MGDIVTVQGLVKKFDDLVAVDHVDFSIAEGEIFGLLGSQRRRQDHHDLDHLGSASTPPKATSSSTATRSPRSPAR